MPTPSRYWREIPQRYRLEGKKCRSCGRVAFPPRPVCPGCGGREFEAVRLAESGKLLTYTVIRVPPEGYEDQSPYAVGIAELDDGVRLTAQVVAWRESKLEGRPMTPAGMLRGLTAPIHPGAMRYYREAKLKE